MAKFEARKHWWVVVLAVAAVGAAVMAAADWWMPDYTEAGFFLGMGLIGAVFCWAYFTDKDRLWWAVIPGLAIFAVMLAGLADIVVGTDSRNDWINVLVLGTGAAVIGAVLKRMDARIILFIVSVITLLVGFLMAPFTLILKIFLIVAVGSLFAYYLLRNRGKLPKPG
jgi:hypothetical protein